MGELRNAVEARKKKLIIKIIASGIYKINDSHLFECTLSDIEKIYQNLASKRKSSRI
ncbi:Fur-regulated basic protein FbpA [Anaerobacillus alkaliphilus]|uniref:Fur-regulated basic protein FbpA n=1 Tax=Anaerobacillus alkaliphilus TaxID=1548597 RepID=A0A4Q0VLW6_9BACI|nr:Fur-regulated basic protein FbpA [Anaerobacillus alkaliphilus]RXI96417.1 Fur-regulated basic protein FbpA [Anaerobacillus alkaliphilus]